MKLRLGAHWTCLNLRAQESSNSHVHLQARRNLNIGSNDEIRFRNVVFNQFAYGSLRDVADGDYIAARNLHKLNLWTQFFWSALQAIEKYQKCILLLRRVPARRLGHNLEGGLSLLKEHLPGFTLSKSTESLIAHLNQIGTDRYFEFTFTVDGHELFYLDRAVWEIRQYCAIPFESEAEQYVEIIANLIKRSQNDHTAPGSCLHQSGQLEKVRADKKHPSRAALLRQNAFFCTRPRKRVLVWPTFQLSNSTRIIYPEYLDGIEQFVQLSKQFTLPKPINVVKS